ncbi:MAG: T9SS type A sorting domain-containing protein [Bacteroidota bacterium]
MKKILLFVCVFLLGAVTMAQLIKETNPSLVKSIPVAAIDIPEMGPVQTGNTSANSKSVLEDNLGQTRYDLQTNEAIQNRFVIFNDGTMAGTWTTSMQDATFSDRGTGYNYYNGTNWMPLVTTRIETLRTGWPSIDLWNGNGEIVVTHQTAITPLVKCTRPVKGTGAWTQTTIPKPTGCAGLNWPRMITNGPNNSYIHIIVCSGPVANGGTAYKGMDPAFLYYRSLDGGATWDKLGIQLPALDSSNYTSFSGDTYAWGAPKGDTIYFCMGGPYLDSFIMKSTDNGDTWTKINILNNGFKKLKSTFTGTIAPWKSSDGAVACEMDNNGVIHFASGIGGGSVTAGTRYIRLYNNGLIYWNTTMAMLPDSLNLDTLDVHGQLLGYYSDGPNPGDTLNTLTSYRTGLSTFPQMSVDAAGNLYVIYSQVTWENPSPEGINFRHIYGRAKFHNKTTWSSDPIDFNAGILYYGQEFVWGTMAKKMTNDKLRFIYQTADQPGTAVGTLGTTGAIPYHDNFFQYREVPGNTFWPTGINGNTVTSKSSVSQNYPNPVKGITYFNINLDQAANVTLEISNIMGQKVLSLDKGMINAGTHRMTIDGNQMMSGIYFYTVRINGEAFTHKMIVE